MENYPKSVHEFIDLNSEKYTLYTGLFFGLLKLIYYVFLFLPLILPLKVLILLVTFGKLNLFKKSEPAKEVTLPYDKLLFSKGGAESQNIEKLKNILKTVSEVRHINLDEDEESIEFGITKDKKEGIIFTKNRILYNLKSPSRVSGKIVTGIMKNEDINKISCFKSIGDSLYFKINDEKIGAISNVDGDNEKRIAKLLLVIESAINEH